MTATALVSTVPAWAEVTLSAVIPLSGSNATPGKDQRRAIEIAVKTVNDAGGVLGGPLEVIIEDSAGKPQTAINAAKKLVSVNDVALVIGSYSSVEEGFHGWGRVTPDFETGIFSFETVKPGKVTGPDARPMAPHLNLWLGARGINVGLSTRMYFDDEDAANAADPVLTLIEQPLRRETLIAQADGNAYHFNIRLQGAGETVFFDL